MLLKLFWEFFKVGSFTLGGGAAMIPQIQEIAVNEKKWLGEEEMLDCIAVGQSLPGVIAVNVATYIGYRKGGMLGAIIATLGVVLPAFLSIIIAVALLSAIGDNVYVTGALTGIKAAVCGLILVAAIKLFRQISGDKKTIVFSVIMCLASLVAVAFFGVTAVIVILAGIVFGIVFSFMKEVKK